MAEEDTGEVNASQDGELHHYCHFKATSTNYQSIRRPALIEGTLELPNWDKK